MFFCFCFFCFFDPPPAPQLKFVVDESSGVRASFAEARREKGDMSVHEAAMVAVGGEVGAAGVAALGRARLRALKICV